MAQPNVHLMFSKNLPLLVLSLITLTIIPDRIVANPSNWHHQQPGPGHQDWHWGHRGRHHGHDVAGRSPHGCPTDAFPASNLLSIPIFLFPGSVREIINVELNGVYLNHSQLAKNIMGHLAHAYPQKWFLVGVGKAAAPGEENQHGSSIRILTKNKQNVLNGAFQLAAIPLPEPPRYSHVLPSTSESEERASETNNNLFWYFVHAVEPFSESEWDKRETDNPAASRGYRETARCVRTKAKRCIPKDLASCNLDFLALIPHGSQPALYMSAQLANSKQRRKRIVMSNASCSLTDNDEPETADDGKAKAKKSYYVIGTVAVDIDDDD